MKLNVRISIVCMTLAFLLGVLSACSFKPTEEDAKKAIENSYKSELEQKLLKINRVTKTNAQDANLAGVQIYNMEVDAELEYLMDVAVCYMPAFIGGGMKMVPMSKYKKMGYWQKFEFENGCSTKVHKVGEKETIKREIPFVKKEKGWEAQ